MKSSKRSSFTWLVRILFVIAYIGGIFYNPVPTQASGVGYGEYYIFGTDADILDALNDIPNSSASGGINSRLSIVSSANGVNIYLDEVEDGYDFDPADAYNTADAKWDIPAGGSGEQGGQLDRGEVLTLTEADQYVTGSTGVGGGDRIYVTGAPVSVVRTVWPDNPGPYLSGSWEIYPVQRWQSSLTIPVGQDLNYATETPASSFPFQYTFLFLEAQYDNTRVVVTDPIGGELYNGVLGQGQNILIKNINSGAMVVATEDGTPNPRNIQGGLITSVNQVYDSRYYTVTPQDYLCNEYYVSTPSMQFPSSENGGRNIYNSAYIYSFQDNTALAIETASGTTNVTLDQGDVYRFVMPLMPRGTEQGDYGVRFVTDDPNDRIWVLVAGDDDAPTLDWGHQALCVNYLSDEYFLPFAPYNPAHITPVNDNTIFYVDWDNDEAVDETFTLDRFETKMLWDYTDNIATGAYISASGLFQIAWGQDNTEDTPGERTYFGGNDLDFGYTILPTVWSDTVLAIEKTASPAVLPNTGGTATFTLVVDAESSTVYNLDVIDTLPANWQYVTDSAILDLSYGTGGNYNPSNIAGSQLTWDLSGLGLDDTMPPLASITVTFQAQTIPGFNYGSNTNFSEAYGSNIVDDTNPGAAIFRPNDTAQVYISPLTVEKVSSAGSYVFPGDAITYTMTITNNGTIRHNNIVVTDTLPTGTTFVSGSIDGYVSTVLEYRDNFDSGTAYNQSDGSTSWSGQFWDETGDNDISTMGTIRIVDANDVLLLENAQGDYIERVIPGDLSGQTVTLVVDYYETGTWEATDTFSIDVWNNDISSWHTVISHADDFGDQGAKTWDISDYAFDGNNTRVRFHSTSNATDEDVYIRYIQVLVDEPAPVSGAAIHNPPEIVIAGDNYTLSPGQVMTMTYVVTVNDPLALGLTEIENNVSITSDQQLTPSQDTVTDPVALGSIGNYVWLDEDGDGVQDAGESGIPNVVIELYSASGTLMMTTTTDANGGYLFPDLPAAAYTVTIDTASMPAGLAANPTYDEDDGTSSPDAETLVSLTSHGQEYLTADFGFNWVPAADSTNPGAGATGAIGDRVWNDADGDGTQDPGEAGISGVTVTLLTPGPDGIFGTSDDVTADTTTTDAAGNYIFDNLPVGAYGISVSIPGGYAQTGDPDESGACAECDNQTTMPIILAPGDVYVNADFGYQSAGATNTIGNQIFVDANGDGNLDGGEPGIPGVTVALLDSSGNLIATTVTDADGQYSFPGLPDGTYTVWVNDTNNVLGELSQNSTPNNAADGGQPCGTCNGQNTVTVSGGGNLNQDFGYAPDGHSSGDGLIGDTVFLDRDGGNDYDPGEGLEGVTVDLYDSTGTILLATTTTDENGRYYFGNLAAGDYIVRVDAGDLPAGVANTVDPDGGIANESNVTLAVGEVNLSQDFGYAAGSPHTIGGTIWEDTDANGILDGVACEGGCFQGVTVALYDAVGNVVATTITDASGNYSFPGLPDGAYRLDVTDENNVLNGYWHSQGDQFQSSDGTSKADPYTVVLSGADVNTVDFGYYVDPGEVGNQVWLDMNNDGVKDADEPGISGVPVTLTITYPGGGSSTIVMTSATDGVYSFGNLLLDENFNAGDAGGGTPTYTISVGAPPGTVASPENANSPTNDDQIDGDSDGSDEIATVNQGETDYGYDFGFFGDVDLGDLPDGLGPDYATYFSPGPAHVVFDDGGDPDSDPDTTDGTTAVWLGLLVDTELNGQPNLAATGDDDNGDDEDGLTFAQNGYLPNATNPVTVTINASEPSATVYFGLWIDWNQDGVFEDFYDGSGVSGSPADVAVGISVPGTYVAESPVYFRLRALDTPLTAIDYEGTFINGEVEDYGRAFTAAPTAIRLKLLATQSGAPTLGWVALAAALVTLPAVLLLRGRKRRF